MLQQIDHHLAADITDHRKSLVRQVSVERDVRRHGAEEQCLYGSPFPLADPGGRRESTDRFRASNPLSINRDTLRRTHLRLRTDSAANRRHEDI